MSERSKDVFGMSNGTSVNGESAVGGFGVQQTIETTANNNDVTAQHNNNIQSVDSQSSKQETKSPDIICLTDSDDDDDDDDEVTSVEPRVRSRTSDDAEISLLTSSDDNASDLSSTDETALYYSQFAQSTLEKSVRAKAAASVNQSTNARLNNAKKRTRIQRKADRAAFRSSMGEGPDQRKKKKKSAPQFNRQPAPGPTKAQRKAMKLQSVGTIETSEAHNIDGSVLLHCTNGRDTVTVHRNYSMADINHVVLCDLDNWRSLFLRIPFALPNDVFISGFASTDTIKTLKVPDDAVMLEMAGANDIPEEELVTLSPFTRLLAAHRIQLTISGCSANAADFAMSFVGGLLHASLPLHVSFTVLSGDRGLEESVRLIKLQGRECRRIDPHALIVKGDSITTDQLIFHTLSSLIRPR